MWRFLKLVKLLKVPGEDTALVGQLYPSTVLRVESVRVRGGYRCRTSLTHGK